MKRKHLVLISLLLTSALFFTSCSKALRDKAVGTWKVESVNVQADDAKYTPEQIQRTKDLESTVYFILNQDLTMSAVTSGTELNGSWYADEDKDEVYIRFEGSTGDATLLGKYQGGNLVKIHKLSGMVITTVYAKE